MDVVLSRCDRRTLRKRPENLLAAQVANNEHQHRHLAPSTTRGTKHFRRQYPPAQCVFCNNALRFSDGLGHPPFSTAFRHQTNHHSYQQHFVCKNACRAYTALSIYKTSLSLCFEGNIRARIKAVRHGLQFVEGPGQQPESV